METQQPRQEPDFDKGGGLVPAIAQDAHTGEVLMLAWMNQEAWRLTKESRVAVYWSRSRQSLWRKGMISGNIQKVKEVLLDCDLDTILLKVEQVGDAACHTGRRSCFHHRVTDEDLEITQEPLFNPKEVYGP